MKVVVAFMVFVTVAAASAQVKEKLVIHEPTLVQEQPKPIPKPLPPDSPPKAPPKKGK